VYTADIDSFSNGSAQYSVNLYDARFETVVAQWNQFLASPTDGGSTLFFDLEAHHPDTLSPLIWEYVQDGKSLQFAGTARGVNSIPVDGRIDADGSVAVWYGDDVPGARWCGLRLAFTRQ
jgi:hypothetical protein